MSIGREHFLLSIGLQPVLSCMVDLYAIRTNGNGSSQSEWFLFTYIDDICNRVVLKRSTRPSDWGLYGAVFVFFYYNKSQNLKKKINSKSLPWSVWISRGTPNLLINSVTSLSATVRAVWFRTG